MGSVGREDMWWSGGAQGLRRERVESQGLRARGRRGARAGCMAVAAVVVMKIRGWLLALSMIGCGGAAENRPERLSAAQHEAEALQHEREAGMHMQAYVDSRREQASSGALHCYDKPIPDPTSGGEPLPVLRPCWTDEERPSRFQLDEAERDRAEAARHRAV